MYQYVMELRTRLEDTCKLAQEELVRAQETQKRIYDRTARPKKLKKGEKVLLLLPTKANKLLLQWKGPYSVVERTSPVNYKIQIGKKIKNYHVNMLRQYHEREEVQKQENNDENNRRRTEAIDGEHVETESETDSDSSEDEHEHEDNRNTSSIIAASLILKDGIGDEVDDSEMIEVCPLKATETWNDVTVSKELSASQRNEVMQLLETHQDILTNLPGKTSLEKHTIKTTTEEPVRDKAYPLPYKQRDVIKNEVESMLKMGVIRKSKSPYAAPPVLVKKPDGSVRFCVNYKKLNSITVFDGEPMPCPEDIYIQMRGKPYRSKLDMTKGYWQISVSEESIQKTAFITPDGVFEFIKLPFGRRNSAASFNRLMRLVLGDIEGVGCFVDDVCMFTNTWDEHIKLLERVFARLRQAGLTLRPTKCMIGYSQVEFVGHVIGLDTVQPRPEKIKDVLEIEKPKSKRDIKSFLAMAGYYGRFIPKFSETTYPLTEMTKRKKTFRWGQEEEVAFQTVKRCLSNEPILKVIDFDRVIYLQTDASDVGVGVGAALVQQYNKTFHPVKFISRKLKAAERNYSVIEKEGLAIVWAVQKLMIYLYGREFILLTDHRPLTFINLSKMHNSRVMRWSMFLQDWTFRVESIKGVDNVFADYLSRV